MRGFRSAVAVLTGLGFALAASVVAAPPAQAATTVRVESTITGRNLPYKDHPATSGTTYYANATVTVQCQATGREAIAGSLTWYRLTNGLYYPSYAFSGTPTHPPCGTAYLVPSSANGWYGPTWQSKPASGHFPGGAGVHAICRVWGDTTDGNNAWFFASGFWIHSSRLSGEPGGTGVPVCRGWPTVAKRSWIPSTYWGLIRTTSDRYAINPWLIAGQLYKESSFNPDAVSPAGAKGIAQFLDGTWNGTWNIYRNSCARDAFDPNCAIPAAGLYMRIMRAEARSRAGQIPSIKQTMLAHPDVTQAMVDAINWNDRYQFGLLGYIGGWGNYSRWGAVTARYPVQIYSYAATP